MQRRHEQFSEEQSLELTLSTNTCSFSPAGETKTVIVYLNGEVLKSSDVALLKTGNCPNSYSYDASTGEITLTCNKNESTTKSYSGTISVAYGTQTQIITCSQRADYVTKETVRCTDISEFGVDSVTFNPDLEVDAEKDSSGEFYRFRRVNGSLVDTYGIDIYGIYTKKNTTQTWASGRSTSTEETGSWTARLVNLNVSLFPQGYSHGNGPEMSVGQTLLVSSMLQTISFKPSGDMPYRIYDYLNLEFKLIGNLSFTPTLITSGNTDGSGTLTISAQNYGNTTGATNRFGSYTINFTC